jgi:drug/metabolite transporter (DMT)-like permease
MIGPASALAFVMLVGFAIVLPIALVRGLPWSASHDDLAWLAVSSAGSVGGLGSGYAALRRGKVSIVAPICATEGAVAAVLAIAFGQHLSPGSALALAAIAGGVTLASIGHDPIEGHSTYPSILLAVAAALMFGVSLYAAGRTGHALGAASILLGARSVGMVVVVVPLLARRSLRISEAALPLVVTSGVLEVAGYGLFIAGVGSGDVAVPAVLSSLFAAVAGLLGFVLLGERLRSIQLAGVATILVGVVALSGLQA